MKIGLGSVKKTHSVAGLELVESHSSSSPGSLQSHSQRTESPPWLEEVETRDDQTRTTFSHLIHPFIQFELCQEFSSQT